MPADLPSVGMSFALLGIGLLLLVGGGEMLIKGAVNLSYRMGLSPLLIGLTVVAFGTSMPELFVSLAANLQGHPDVMTGNVVGSNIANIGLILAISALIAPLPVHFSRIAKELYLVLGASIALYALTWFGFFPRLVGFLFVAGLVIYTWRAYQDSSHRLPDDEENASVKGSPAAAVVIAATGIVMLAFGSDFFIDGAVGVATHFGVSELVIGLTLAAVGTSLPELASSVAAVRYRESDLLVGNIVGSNLFNLLMVMGTTAAFADIPLTDALRLRDVPVMIGFAVLLAFFIQIGHVVKRWHGLLLLAGYIAYIYLLAV